MVVEKASRVEQVGVWGVFCLDGGEEGGFKEEFLATGDEVVF